MTKIYGIKNCDTIKKAKAWLDKHQLPYQFIDYRADGLSAEQLALFAEKCGWKNLLNTRGTTYRQLEESDKTALTEQRALTLMLAQPSMIKRPLLIHNENYVLGFSATEYQQIFGTTA